MGILSRKLRSIIGVDGRAGVAYWCQGCDGIHSVWYDGKGSPNWSWNGHKDLPTFSPSVLLRDGSKVCHTFVRSGVVTFLSDCTHQYKGTDQPLPDLPEWLQEEHMTINKPDETKTAEAQASVNDIMKAKESEEAAKKKAEEEAAKAAAAKKVDKGPSTTKPSPNPSDWLIVAHEKGVQATYSDLVFIGTPKEFSKYIRG